MRLGLDNLTKRARYFKQNGCQFAKWRAVYTIGKLTPSNLALTENANILARYAFVCQKEGLLPVIEYAVNHNGTHNLSQSQAVCFIIFNYDYK